MKMELYKGLKIVDILLIVGMAFVVSCTEETSPDLVSENEIVFGLDLPDTWLDSRESRATIVDNTRLVTAGFGVFAFYAQQTPDFMNNTKVYSTNGGTSWEYKPVKYWPNNEGDDIDFFAYAPYDASFSVKNKTELTYVVPQNVAQQKDLLWSNTNTQGKTKADGTVHFNFHHALSRIGFTAEAKLVGTSPIDGWEKVNMKVKKIVLTSITDKTGTGTGPFYEQGILNLNNQTDNPVWMSCTGTQSYTLSAGQLASHDLTLTETNTSVGPKELSADGSYLMILPQDLQTEGFHVYVEYDVNLSFTGNGYEGSGYYEYSTYTNGCVGTLKINFEPGKAYTINIQLGLEDATLGEVTMTEWGDGGNVTLEDLLEEKE